MKFSSSLVVLGFAWLVVSFWHRNDLPGDIDVAAATLEEPAQRATRTRAFEVRYNDVDYRVEPQYDYELTGLVVSFRHHDEDRSRMHRLAKDHLNMLDICVVWGDNTRAPLGKIDFWNGLFTCNVFTRDPAAWDAFDMHQLSNNHLLSDDDAIRDRVLDIRIGDQIRVRGHLASYTSPVGRRGTSTTRTDTGDGACETVFVRHFEILRPATSYWRISMYVSLVVLLVGLALHFLRPYRPYRTSGA